MIADVEPAVVVEIGDAARVAELAQRVGDRERGEVRKPVGAVASVDQELVLAVIDDNKIRLAVAVQVTNAERVRVAGRCLVRAAE